VSDSISLRIDSTLKLISEKHSIDTVFNSEYGKEELKEDFEVYRDPETNQCVKITITEHGSYFRYVEFYFHNGKAFKGQVHERFRQTDTNPEVELNTVSYFENNKVIYSYELLPSKFKGNVFWYLLHIQELIKYSGIEL
jgi:hypothetical protein